MGEQDKTLARSSTMVTWKMFDALAGFEGAYLNDWVDVVKQAGLPED